MIEALDLLKARASQFAKDHPNHPDLSKLERFIADGETLLVQPPPEPAAEQVTFRERFTDEEKRVLLGDGAAIYLPTGTTIAAQREIRVKERKLSFFSAMTVDGLIDLPSRQVEVAIFPDPQRFFVPGSFNVNVTRQEKLVKEDAEKELHGRLGLDGVTQIIPKEAATLTEVAFMHFDETGVLLFGPEYDLLSQRLGVRTSNVFGITKNPTNSAGSFVAAIGGALKGVGVDVRYPPELYTISLGGLCMVNQDRISGSGNCGVVRLVVPIEN